MSLNQDTLVKICFPDWLIFDVLVSIMVEETTAPKMIS